MKFCRPDACTLMWLTIVVLLPTMLPAQVGTSDALSSLRSKSNLTADEITLLDDFLDNQLSRVASEPNDARACKRFRDQIVGAYSHSGNSDAFKRRFVERCSARFGEQIRSGQGQQVLTLLYTLSALSDPETLPAVKEAANSGDAGARLLAVRAIWSMADKIAADPARHTEVIQWLEEVGRREQNGSVLSVVFAALNFSAKRDEQAVALVNILEARLANYRDNAVVAVRADSDGLMRAPALADALSDDDRRRLVGVLAKYLAYYTHRYMYVDLAAASRTDLHRLIFLTERLLTTVTGITAANPSVSAAISSPAADRYDKIKQALASWVGSQNNTGRLNGNPWQVVTGAVGDLDFSTPVPKHPDDPEPDAG